MQDKKQQAEELLDRYLSGNCTEQERNLVERLYSKETLSKKFKEEELDLARIGNESWAQIQEHTFKINQKDRTISILWRRIAVAASLFICFGLGIYFYQQSNTPIIDHSATAHVISPGSNRATLTLADGRTIDLSDNQEGIIIDSDNIKYNDGSSLLSHVIGTEAEQTDRLHDNPDADVFIEAQTYTLSTPKGGQYQITLHDGTKVWLNAASTLKYPSHFKGNEREVEVIGEAYFEVSHNPANSFIVKTENQKIEVLGTHFNIMAYPDENTAKTTLFEGSVKVSNATSSQLLTPGQQLQVVNGKMNLMNNNVDLEEALAWKNGYFKFSENLESIMNKVARWYDVEVVYEIKPDPTMTFAGKISRDKDIKEIFEIMESTGNIHFKIEGRRITVMK